MIIPRLFGESLFDELMDDFPFTGHAALPRLTSDANAGAVKGLMKTDVREKDGSYILDIDLPGFKKEDIKIELNDGYLTVSAARNYENEDKDANGKYIRRERFCGSCSRTFFAGEEVKPEDIKAKFEEGILTLSLPKEQPKQIPQKNNIIAIEG